MHKQSYKILTEKGLNYDTDAIHTNNSAINNLLYSRKHEDNKFCCFHGFYCCLENEFLKIILQYIMQ